MLNRNWVPVLALVMGAAPLLAQDAPPPGQPKVRIERSYGGPGWGGPGEMQFTMTRRARLGIKVNLQARATDSIGAYVDGVTPGGPAAKAGLEAGDVITKLDGTSLVGGSGGKQGNSERSLPGMRLIELAARLPGNDTISVDYRRGKDRKSTTLVTQEDPENVFVTGPDGGNQYSFRFFNDGPGFDGEVMPGMGMQMEGMRGPMPPGMKMRTPMMEGDAPFRVFISSDLEELELVPLNPDLAPYFGATDGVLVINVPQGSTLGLKGGDVVLMIDGRKPANTAQMHRILRSYDAGNTVKFEILRNRKTATVTGTIPSPPEMKWRTTPDSAVKTRTRSSTGT
jgi:membrane-associated protease RseP (regulator of RpoE activity)